MATFDQSRLAPPTSSFAPAPLPFMSSGPEVQGGGSCYVGEGGVTDPAHLMTVNNIYGQSEAPPDPVKMMQEMTATTTAITLTAYSKAIDDDAGRNGFMMTLDKINDPEVRKLVIAKFPQMNGGETLQHFIDNCSDFKKRDAAVADDLLSSKWDDAEKARAKMTPAERDALDAKASDWAAKVMAVTRADDASDDVNSNKIFDVLGPRTPVEMEAIRAAIRTHSHGDKSLYLELDDHLSKGNEDEAVQDMSGDPVANAAKGLANAGSNKTRIVNLLKTMQGENLPKLLEALKQQKVDTADLISAVPEGEAREEVAGLLAGNSAKADAAMLGDLLKDPDDGTGAGIMGRNYNDIMTMKSRDSDNVLKQFESMTPEQIKAAQASWDSNAEEHSQGGKPMTFAQMVQDRFGDKPEVSGRLFAVLKGDVAKDKALHLEQAMKDGKEDEIEAVLSNPDLKSEDAGKKAEAELQKQMLNMYVMTDDLQKQNAAHSLTGAPIAGPRDVKAQLDQYYKDEAKKGPDGFSEKLGVEIEGLDDLQKAQQARQAHRDEVGADELWEGGSLTDATQVFRARFSGDKDHAAELINDVKSGEELAKDQKEYADKYGGAQMVGPAAAFSDRDDMNRDELLIDNVARYGAVSERSPEQQHQLQLELYDHQKSTSLELEEMKRGGGTQAWTREELLTEQDMLDANGQLKSGVTAAQFGNESRATDTALATQAEEKKKLAEHYAHMFDVMLKIAAVLAMQPELVMLIDLMGGLTEMAIKRSVMGNDYDAKADGEMVALTLAADAVLWGLASEGKIANQALATEIEASKLAQETAEESVTALTKEAKTDAVVEGVQKAAGENPVLKDAAKDAGDVGSASASEATGSAKASSTLDEASNAQKTAAEEQAKKIEEAQKTAEEAKEATKRAQENLEKAEKNQGHVAALTKGTITTVGGGMINGDSPEDIMKKMGMNILGEFIPGGLGEKIEEMGGGGTAAKIAGAGTSYVAGVGLGGDYSAEAWVMGAVNAGGELAKDHMRESFNEAKTNAPLPVEPVAPEATTSSSSAAAGPLPEAAQTVALTKPPTELPEAAKVINVPDSTKLEPAPKATEPEPPAAPEPTVVPTELPAAASPIELPDYQTLAPLPEPTPAPAVPLTGTDLAAQTVGIQDAPMREKTVAEKNFTPIGEVEYEGAELKSNEENELEAAKREQEEAEDEWKERIAEADEENGAGEKGAEGKKPE